MIALALAHFPAEHPIDEHDVAEDDRQQRDGADQHEQLARRRGREVPPFLGSIALFLFGYLGLVISTFPYLVPPTLTVWQTAAAPASENFGGTRARTQELGKLALRVP